VVTRVLLCAGLVMLATSAPADEKSDAVAKEMKLLEEKVWVTVAKADLGGKEEKVPDDMRATLVFGGGGKATLKLVGLTVELLDVKIDPTAKPKTIDCNFKIGDEKSVVAGLYELKGDELRMAVNVAAAEKVERPKDFEKCTMRIVFAGKEKPKK